MNQPRRLYALLVIGIAMVAAAMLLVFATIQQQIAEARLDLRENLSRNASQFEFELSSLRGALILYYSGDEYLDDFSVVERHFDIFWSRVYYAKKGALGERYMSLEHAPALITQAKAVLHDVEQLMPELKNRSVQALDVVMKELEELRAPILANISESFEHTSSDVKRQKAFLVSSLNWIVGLFGGVVLIGGAVIGILYRDKLNIERLHNQLEMRVQERTQEIEEKNVELEHANDRLRQFAFAASHDLQEPLRRIKLFSVDLAEEIGDKVSKDQRFAINSISKAADRLRDLVARLLAYTRISQQVLELKPVNLNEIAKDVLHDHAMQIQEAEALIEVGTLPILMADDMQVRQLFQNLISNAIKFRAQDRRCEITIGWTEASDICRIRVSDNGIGFAPEYKEKVFEPFQQLHGKKSYGGAGIGLAICARVIERHGWKMIATGEPGEGAVFTIEIQHSSICTADDLQAA